MPITDVADFNARIVDATRDLVCAYKPNFPFYEALGTPRTPRPRKHRPPTYETSPPTPSS